MIFDFGFERQELIFPNKHFGLGQFHDLLIRRKNSGATLVMEVSNFLKFEYFQLLTNDEVLLQDEGILKKL